MKETINKVLEFQEELFNFINDKEFKKYGFAIAFKYNTWLKKVTELKERLNSENRNTEEMLVWNLQSMGLSYAITKGKETEPIINFKKAIEESILELQN